MDIIESNGVMISSGDYKITAWMKIDGADRICILN